MLIISSVWSDLLQSKWEELRQHYPGDKLLIVSNSAGTEDDKDYAQALQLERETGVKVLRHSTKVGLIFAYIE